MTVHVRRLNLLNSIAGSFLASVVLAQTQVKPGEKVTEVGEQLQMQCGDFKVLLQCQHSEQIAARQRKYPRVCNDNRLIFVSQGGTSKIFETYTKGKERDKTPVEAECEQYLPINKYQVRVLIHDTASSSVIRLTGNAEPIEKADQLRYRVDYDTSRTVSFIAIREVPSWQ